MATNKAPTDELIIENWQKGMAQHPLLGFGLLRDVDIVTYPGLVRLNKVTTKTSSTTVTNMVYFIVRDPTTGNLYALDKTSKLYVSTNGGSSWTYVSGFTESGVAWGLAVWKDYVFIATTTGLDVMKISDSSKTLLWQANTGSGVILDPTLDFHTMFASQDDKLYICCGRYIVSIAELTTFAPGTSSTYTFTARAITLATGYNAKCLADLGSTLEIGTWFGTNFGLDQKIADIFPYYRSTLLLGIPLKLAENGTHAMITVGNRLYILAGISGKLFISDGVSVQMLTKVSTYAVAVGESNALSLLTYPQSIMHHRGKIFFGIGIDSNSGINNLGIWSWDITNKVLQMENIVSTLNDGTSNNLLIAGMYSLGVEAFLYGFRDGSTYGIDKKDDTNFYTGTQPYPGIIESPLYQVGESLRNRTFSQCEVYFTKPLKTGQGIQILYRTNLTSGYVLLATIDFATYGAIQSQNIPAAVITNAVFLQIKINMTGDGSNSPELKRVMFKMSQ